MVLKRIRFSRLTPGQRIAARRAMTARPGTADFVDEGLRTLCDLLRSDAVVAQLVGEDGPVRVEVLYDREGHVLQFIVSRS